MGAPISQGGPQNVKILGLRGPRILKFWGPEAPKWGAPFLHDTGPHIPSDIGTGGRQHITRNMGTGGPQNSGDMGILLYAVGKDI